MTGTVLDASVIVELLIVSPLGRRVAGELPSRRAGGLHIPHLAVVETASVLRGLVLGSRVATDRAEGALADLAVLPCTRWPVEGLLPRLWQLRDNLTAYDATYVALAEALDAELVTADRRLARAAADVATCPITLVA
ncbi:type II toxin-antitoxin system VapC family toxin [Nocardioides mangrovi]|uniref:Ribonuclease VapC n=1 Tax=Nocardioides mangrovi TaxID=2874580 RepID=A0ABS7U6X3_9ACTN|nr:type II toxin-antitoxin system VapC family toxin [Nocardioides mangrovi]MBZ5736597.1 type II toxin-antitoxin system VapC family toxin [Nocardioides mangrovi]